MQRLNQLFFISLWVMLFAISCRSAGVPDEALPPTAVSISNETGQTLVTQEEPIWVLLSGVDEHGLVVEDELLLLTQPDSTINSGTMVHSGVSAAVLEIRQGGEQNLQRFYHVETADGAQGWISDYYVRRVAYLYDGESDGVSLFATSDGQETVIQLPNVSPVVIKEPANGEWWLVQSVENETLGWVLASFVKESPSPEFLRNQAHPHE